MLKKVVVFTSILALVLASAQLALAQQDTQPTQVQATHQDISATQPTSDTQTPPGGASQAAALDPSPRNMIPDPPLVSASQAAGNDHHGLMHLSNNNELVIECVAVDDALAQLAANDNNLTQPQGAPSPTSQQSPAELTGLEELSQLCAEGGFVPVSGGGDAPSTSSPTGASPTTQPQQSGSESSPTGISSTQPQQNTGTIPGG